MEIHVLDALSKYWEESYGIKFESTHVSFCENHPSAQLHLAAQFPGVPILEDINLASELGQCKDHVTKKRIDVTKTAQGFVAGFSCVSRSPKNAKAKEHVGCIQTVA